MEAVSFGGKLTLFLVVDLSDALLQRGHAPLLQGQVLLLQTQPVLPSRGEPRTNRQTTTNR